MHYRVLSIKTVKTIGEHSNKNIWLRSCYLQHVAYGKDILTMENAYQIYHHIRNYTTYRWTAFIGNIVISMIIA